MSSASRGTSRSTLPPWFKPRKGRHTKKARTSLWRSWPLWGPLVLGLLVSAASVQLARPVPAPSTHAELSSASVVPGTPAIPWPTQGEGAVAVPSLGLLVSPGPEKPVPIASLTKIMTAFLVLRDHPITPDAQGPGVTISASDQREEIEEAEANDTSLPVQPGEVLTERQLLNGLMVHSANNFADILARWDAGSTAAFVSKMNAEAASLGMEQTHYADTDGIDPMTVSTAYDQLKLASAAMDEATFAAVVGQPSISLPLAGIVPNYVSEIGTDGIVGVKSGFTQAAMGCLVLAGERSVAGREVLVMAAVTGQLGVDPLDAAAQQTAQMLDATARSLEEVPAVEAGEHVASVTTDWTPDAVVATAGQSLDVLAWPGETVHVSMRPDPLRPRTRAGTRLGTLLVSVGTERLTDPVLSAGRIDGPSLAWRLARF